MRGSTGAGHAVAEQAEARLARLRAVAVLDLGFEQGVAAEAPVARQREEVAMAAQVVQRRVEALHRRVQAQAEGATGAEALAQVDGAEHAAGLAPGERRVRSGVSSGRLTT